MSLYNDDVWCVTIDKIRSTGSIQVSLLHIVMIVELNASSTILLQKMSSALLSLFISKSHIFPCNLP